MKRYALLLACLGWALVPNGFGQTAGAGGTAGGTGGTSGAVGSGIAGAGTAVGGATPGVAPGSNAIRPGTGIRPGTLRPEMRPGAGAAPGVNPVNPPLNPVNPPVGTPGTGINTGTGTDTGAIGGVGPGVGGTGGVEPGVGGIGGVTTPGTGTTGDVRGAGNAGAIGAGTAGGVETGVNGIRGATTPGQLRPGLMGPMAPADLALTQQIRAQLLMGRGIFVPGTRTTASAPAGVLPPQVLSGVQMTANNGVVTLRGNVATEADRRLLETRIRTINGVRAVVNGLRVIGPNGTTGGAVLPGVTP